MHQEMGHWGCGRGTSIAAWEIGVSIDGGTVPTPLSLDGSWKLSQPQQWVMTMGTPNWLRKPPFLDIFLISHDFPDRHLSRAEFDKRPCEPERCGPMGKPVPKMINGFSTSKCRCLQLFLAKDTLWLPWLLNRLRFGTSKTVICSQIVYPMFNNKY